jgi:hypothetical protein
MMNVTMHRTSSRTGRILLLVLAISVAFPIGASATTDGNLPRLMGSASRLRTGAIAPRAASLGTQSINWSGYAITGATYRVVTGQWTVPKVTPTGGLSASAIWIGIDGVLEDNLIQVGTEQDSLNGRTGYNAWWEILPAPATPITAFSVRPGDRISAQIARVSAGVWRITITDARSGSFSITRAYIGSGTSAEWIEEAPFLGRRLAPLARHGIVAFDKATVNRVNPKLKASAQITMVRNGLAIATPSGPDSDGDGFSIRQGATAPAPPGS